MKKLSIVVHTSLQQELADCLRGLKLESFMFTHIEEHSSQLKQDVVLSARDKVVGYVPKVRVDIILKNDKVRALLEALRYSQISFAGKGTYWVCDIEEAGEL